MVVVLWVFGPMTDQMTAACRSDESSHLVTKATHARSDGLLDNLEAVEAASTGAHATPARSAVPVSFPVDDRVGRRWFLGRSRHTCGDSCRSGGRSGICWTVAVYGCWRFHGERGWHGRHDALAIVGDIHARHGCPRAGGSFP